MALTRDFRETILARAQRDGNFREALFTEAMNACLNGDTSTGNAILRDLVNVALQASPPGLQAQQETESHAVVP